MTSPIRGRHRDLVLTLRSPGTNINAATIYTSLSVSLANRTNKPSNAIANANRFKKKSLELVRERRGRPIRRLVEKETIMKDNQT